jgi:hypothetical protein
MITAGLKDPGVRRLYLTITKDETTIQFWTTFAADVFLKLTSEQVSAENVEGLRAFLLKLADETKEVEGRVEDVTEEVVASAGLVVLVNYLVVLLINIILLAGSAFALEQPARREIMPAGPDPFGIAASTGNAIYAVASWMSSIPLWRPPDDMSLIDSNVAQPMGPPQMPTSLVLYQPDTSRYVRSFGQLLIGYVSNLWPSSPVPAAPLAIGAGPAAPLAIGAVTDEILTCAAGMYEGINASIPVGSMANASQYVANSSVEIASALAENIAPSTTTIAIGAGALLAGALLFGAYKKRHDLTRRARKIKADFTLISQRLTGSYFTNFEKNVESVKLKFDAARKDVETEKEKISRELKTNEGINADIEERLLTAKIEMEKVLQGARDFKEALEGVKKTLVQIDRTLGRLGNLNPEEEFIEREKEILKEARDYRSKISAIKLSTDKKELDSDAKKWLGELQTIRDELIDNVAENDLLRRRKENIDRKEKQLQEEFNNVPPSFAKNRANLFLEDVQPTRIFKAALRPQYEQSYRFIEKFLLEDRVEDINDNSANTATVENFPEFDLSPLEFRKDFDKVVRDIDRVTKRIKYERDVNSKLGRIGRKLEDVLNDHRARTQTVQELQRELDVRIVNHERAIEESLAEIEAHIGGSEAITTRLDERLRLESVNVFSEEIEDLRNLFFLKDGDFAQIDGFFALARGQVERVNQNIRLRASAETLRGKLRDGIEKKLADISSELDGVSKELVSFYTRKQSQRSGDGDGGQSPFDRLVDEAGDIDNDLDKISERLQVLVVDEEPPLLDIPSDFVDKEDRFEEIVRSFNEAYVALEQLIEFRKRKKADRIARERAQHEEFIRRIRRGEGFAEPTEDAARSRAKQEEEEAARRKEQENRKLVEELQELRKDPLMFKVYHSWKTKYLNCVHGHRFLEFDNVGGWQCLQHALPYDTVERVWPCCDNSFENQGCVRADHRTRDTPYSDEQTITTLHRVIVKRLGANRHGFRAPSSYVRYDRDQHQRRIREASMRSRSRQKYQNVNRSRGADTVDILMPRLLRFDLSSEGEIIVDDKEDIWLWNWDAKNRPYIITFPTLSNTFAYVFEKTERSIWIKAAELVRDVELLFKGGRYGVYYHNNPRSDIEFTPIERVAQWEESSA